MCQGLIPQNTPSSDYDQSYTMAHRYYCVETCALRKDICYKAVLIKIEMVDWEVRNGLVKDRKFALSQEIKELLENYHIKISIKAMDIVHDRSIWTDKFRNSKDFNEVSQKIIDTIRSKGIFTYGIWKYFNKQKIRWDHTVPTSVIIDKILSLYDSKSLTFEAFSSIVQDAGFITIITEDEDKKLNELGLRQKMPADWDLNGATNAFARYDKAGIEIFEDKDLSASDRV